MSIYIHIKVVVHVLIQNEVICTLDGWISEVFDFKSSTWYYDIKISQKFVLKALQSVSNLFQLLIITQFTTDPFLMPKTGLSKKKHRAPLCLNQVEFVVVCNTSKKNTTKSWEREEQKMEIIFVRPFVTDGSHIVHRIFGVYLCKTLD